MENNMMNDVSNGVEEMEVGGTFLIRLSKEEMEVFDKILSTRSGKTHQQLMKQIVERGLYALNYRSERNKKVYAEQKEEREELKALRQELRNR